MTADVTYTAIFEAIPYYTITVLSNDEEMGTVTGGGTYREWTSVLLTATANSGYHFSHWSDGNTLASRGISVTEDATYIAYFEADPTYTITVNCNDDEMGTVSGGGTYVEGSHVTITATPNDCYQFTHWQDGNTQRTRTITVTADATYTAYFEAKPTYVIITEASSPEMGQVEGGGTYCKGTHVTITATANEGYIFLRWNDGIAMASRTITVNNDATYIAYFESVGGTEGIDDITSDQIKIYSRGSEIVIEGAEDSETLIYDVMGRIVHKGRIESSIRVSNTGVYMVKIGDRQPQKVVVR